jgi:hypothetical protein
VINIAAAKSLSRDGHDHRYDDKESAIALLDDFRNDGDRST